MNGRSIISSAYLIIILVHYKLYTREEKIDRSKSERPRKELKRGLDERHACMMSRHAP